MGFFFKRSRVVNSAVPGRIRLKFEIILDVMVVLLTCKNEEDTIKNEGARVLTRLYIVLCPHTLLATISQFALQGK